MSLRGCLGWMFAATLSLPSGSVLATSQDCLSYRDNPHVAACANQYGYGPGAAGLRPRSAAAPVQPRAQPIQTATDSELRTVAVVRGGKPPPAPEPEGPRFAVDRTVLTNTVVTSAVGASLLVLVAMGVWRWSLTLMKKCPYCDSKMSRSAHSCRRCFRAA